MTLSTKTRYGMTFTVIVLGALVELFRGYRPLIVGIGFVTFLLVGFGLVYASGAPQRAHRRRLKREYYAGLSE